MFWLVFINQTLLIMKDFTMNLNGFLNLVLRSLRKEEFPGKKYFFISAFTVFLIFPQSISSQITVQNVETGKIDKLEQSANGALGSETDPTSWVTGIVNKSKAHYLEDMSIPYRLTISSLDPTKTYTLTIGFDTQKDGLHAIDYLTSYNYVGSHSLYSNHGIETVDPLQGSGWSLVAKPGKTLVNADWEFIPTPDVANGNPTYQNLSDDDKKMWIFNGDFVSVSNGDQDPLLPGETTVSRVIVQFKPNSDKVIIAWGGHISTWEDWGEGLSASAIQGAPYHMFLDSCDEAKLDGCGQKDVQLSADAVSAPPTCEISGVETVCQASGNLTYTGTVDNASNPTYSWIISSITKTEGTDPSIVAGTEDDQQVEINVPDDFAGSYSLKLIVTNEGVFSLTGYCEFTTTVYDNPDPTPSDLELCERSEGDLKAVFNLNNGVSAEGTGALTFHLSQEDADSGDNPIANPGTYLSGDDTIFVREESDSDGDPEIGCYGTTSFSLTVYDNPDPTPSDLELCERSEGDLKAVFNLNNGVSAEGTGALTFHLSQEDADSGDNPIANPGTYLSGDDTIFVREESDSDGDPEIGCYGTTSFSLTVYDNPDPTPSDLELCERSEGDLKAVFNLNNGVSAEGTGALTFHLSQEDADSGDNPIANPGTYLSGDDTIFVREESDSDGDPEIGCYGTTSFSLTVYDNPDPTPSDLELCERSEGDLKAVFNLNNGVSAEGTGALTFHLSQEDADSGDNPIANPGTYLSGDDTIFVREESDSDGDPEIGCYGTTSFSLTVYDNPDPTPSDLELCERSEGDLKAVFNLNNGVSAEGTGALTFHLSQEDADSGDNPIANPGTYLSGDDTIFVREESDSDGDPEIGCYGTTSFSLTVYDNPDITATYPSVCLGETIDLAQMTEGVYDYISNPDAAVLKFYGSLADVDSDTQLSSTTVSPDLGDNTYYILATSTFGDDTCESITPVTVTGIECIVCETAFAKADVNGGDAYCFSDDSNPFGDPVSSERWGWTNEFEASDFTEDTPIILNLYAGAGQCDNIVIGEPGTGKGVIAGQVIITYDDGYVTVEYDMTLYGFVMSSAHLYVGCDPYPSKKKGKTTESTVAPGQFPFSSSSTGYFDKFEPDPIWVGTSGKFYIIAHADVCTSKNNDHLEYYPQLTSNQEIQYLSAKKRNAQLEMVCGGSTKKGGPAAKTGAESLSIQSVEIVEEPVVETDVALYPVPFSDVINIDYDFDYTSDVKIEVFDFRGNHLRSYSDLQVKRGSTTTLNIDFALKANQMYVVQVITDREKFVKQIVSSKK
ncbi:T9SS type A sorting domain-containing protein [Salinimicrobium sp. CAU 1759]